MKVSLLKGLDKQGKTDLAVSFKQALVYRRALIRNLTHKINEQRNKSSSEKFILEGDFAVKMAWAMGYEKAQRESIALMESQDEK